MYNINNKSSILITGGTGSFGYAFVSYILKKLPEIKRLVIFSRDEFKQFQMKQIFPPSKFKGLRFYIGDIRDKERLERALDGIDIVIHAAALKQIDSAEQNPFECIKTNVLGTQNLVEACLEQEVLRLVCLSTDKAASPSNLYGASKLCSERLILSASNYRGTKPLISSIVRYGNVLGSRGSVVPAFINQLQKGKLFVTANNMTRSNILLKDGVELVRWAIENMIGNEIFVPKLSSYRILDLVEAMAPNAKIDFIGKRSGEKIHEIMITNDESLSTVELETKYVILPTHSSYEIESYAAEKKADIIKKEFTYSSETNQSFLSPNEIRKLLISEGHIES